MDDLEALRAAPPLDASVLVLGSGGLVGRSMVRWLQREGYVVHEVKNRRHIDLRLYGALHRFKYDRERTGGLRMGGASGCVGV